MNDSDRSHAGGRSESGPLDKGMAAAFGAQAGAAQPQPSVLHTLQARTGARLGVHLDSPGPDDAPVRVTDEAKALRDPAGRYQLLGEIGRGGMGIVYKGRDQDLGRDVAMKVLKDEYAARADVLARFVEEAQIGGQLQHPGIVPVYELGLQSGERPYFAMKLIKGETLAALLSRRGDATQERRRMLGIFEQVCQTMAYAHTRHVVHRDLKPANVMIGAFGEVQVVDWGFAKVLQKGGLADEAAATKKEPARSVIETARSRADSGSHSVMGSMFGTPAYMPPEQALGDITRIDERSDVFALGAILCEILTGEPPYRAEDGDLVRQAANAQLDGALARLAHCGADEALVALCRECLSPSQRARPASAAEVAERVSAYLTSVEERARQAEVRAAEARLKHRVTLLSAGAGVLVLALAAAGWLWTDAQARARRGAATERVASAMSAASGTRGRAQSAAGDMSLWASAVAGAEQLVSLAASDDVDAKTRGDAEVLLAAVRDEAQAAQAESDRRARDTRMLAQLEAARIPADEDVRKNSLQELQRLDAAYAKAFAGYLDGVSLFEQPGGTALASTRRGSIAVELAGSLDHWGLVRDALGTQADAPDRAGTARIRDLARELDAGDAWRTQLRALLPNAANESIQLRALADQADFAGLTAVGCRVLSQALWSAGEKEAAITVLRRGQETHPQDFDLCFQLALRLELLDLPRPEEAIEVYRIAHAIRPEQKEVLHRQVLALEGLGRHVDEERLSRLLVAHDPRSSHWLLHLGSALNGQARLDEAIAVFRKALELDPQNALLHDNLGADLQRQGRLEEALASLRKANELEPANADVLANLAVALNLHGEHDEAIACSRRLLELDPENARAHAELGTALYGRGQRGESIPSFRKALELDPRNAIVATNLAIALSAQGQLDEAVEAYRKAIELGDDDASTQLDLGKLFAAQGKPAEAIASYRRALEFDSRSTPALNRLGIALRGQGDTDEASECFQRSLAIDPGQAAAALNLGTCFVDTGDFERALVQFRRAAELFAQDPSPFGRDWLEKCEAYIARAELRLDQRAKLDEVLGSRTAISSEEWSAAVRSGYERRRYRDVVTLTEVTLREKPELIDDIAGLYDSACCATLLAASVRADVRADERLRARGLARAWLSRDVERWSAQVAQGGSSAAATRGRFDHALADADFASVRGDAIDALPEEERAAWRELWKRIEAGSSK